MKISDLAIRCAKQPEAPKTQPSVDNSSKTYACAPKTYDIDLHKLCYVPQNL